MHEIKIGKLFVFEGPNEVGKTTLAQAFAKHLTSINTPCEYYSFPGNIPQTLGKHIYDIHHNINKIILKNINPTSLQLLHIAAHIDTLETYIKPSLKKGHHVALDRFWWSTLIYGKLGNANAQSLKAMIELEKTHWGKIKPSVVFLISRKEPINDTSTAKWKDIAAEYKKLAKEEESNYTIHQINNENTVEEALQEIIELAKSSINLLTK